MSDSRPIGIFDSGIGGLTVASAISRILPQEQFIYFGDTAHLPYGDKSAEAIKHYSVKITQLLREYGAKIIVIACNTASAAAYKSVQKMMPAAELTINVIDPVVDFVLAHGYQNIGIIGTKRTIGSNVYAKKILKANPALHVPSLATPLLAPMIEEGFYNNKISQTIINSYLSKKKLEHIDAIVLACTHYPLIRKEVDHFYKGQVDIIDSASVVASKVKAVLKEQKLLNTTAASKRTVPQHRFYVSDYTSSFEQTTRIFFGQKVKLQSLNIWE